MTCPACTAAETNPTGSSYRAGCTECAARSLANGPLFFAAQQAEAMTPAYRRALDRAFAGDAKAGHERVKAWAAKISTRRAN
jgi:hypothetical protein